MKLALVDKINTAFGNSKVGTYFDVVNRKSTLTAELRAGTVTFLTMAYILAVNAAIIGETGGPCTPEDCTGPLAGTSACKFANAAGDTDPGFDACLDLTKRSLITATAASSLIGCFLMGVGGNLPIALAPGMGLNAYFTYNVVGFRGTGSVSYKTALAAVFIEGFIFVFLAVTGVRSKIIRMIPKSVMLATSAGIGLYLAHIGLQRSEGLNVVTYDSATIVTLGGCPAAHQQVSYTITDTSGICLPGSTLPELPPPSSAVHCDGHKMTAASTWLGLAGLAIIAVLMQRQVKGAIIVGLLFVTFISWIPNHAASYLGGSSDITGGADRMSYFKKVVAKPQIYNTGAAFDFSGFGSGSLWIALITFLYVDFLDTTGTLFSMCNFVNMFIPGFINERREFPRMTFAFCVDGIATSVGALMGTSPVTAFIESASGIREGGRTGLTACVVGCYMFIALFFTPLLASIPPYAVGPALLVVGSLMMMNAASIPWNHPGDAIPAFLTIVMMPLTYSIAYGVIAGIVSYMIINFSSRFLDLVYKKLGWPIKGEADLSVAAPDLSLHKAELTTELSSPVDDSASGGSLKRKQSAAVPLANPLEDNSTNSAFYAGESNVSKIHKGTMGGDLA
ncbi:hypothetical protein ABBQ38_008857 [Trebouxia sp. C0009 RCD-2024]